MKRRSLVAIGVAVYALALVRTAPATLFDVGLRDASDGRLRIAQAQGTLWSGDGQLEIRDADGTARLAKPVAWAFRPATLLRARLGFEIRLDPGTPPFQVALAASRVELTNARIQLPAAALGLLPKLAPLGLTGELDLEVPDLAVGRASTHGSAIIRWRGAGSALSPVAPLGDYELRAVGEGPALRLTLVTLQGPLQLGGQGALANGQRPVFLATASMAPEFRPQLAPFLRLVAVEGPDGNFTLQVQ